MAEESTYAIATGPIIVRNLSTLEPLLDLFNPSGTGKKLRLISLKISARPSRSNLAYVARSFQIEVWRTSGAGTHGSVEPIVSHDTSQTVLPVTITCRTDPTVDLSFLGERILATSMWHDEAPVTEPVSHYVYRYQGEPQKPLTIRPGEGMLIRHMATGNTVANVAVEAIFTAASA